MSMASLTIVLVLVVTIVLMGAVGLTYALYRAKPLMRTLHETYDDETW